MCLQSYQLQSYIKQLKAAYLCTIPCSCKKPTAKTIPATQNFATASGNRFLSYSTERSEPLSMNGIT
jgi:hypothetical protein